MPVGRIPTIQPARAQLIEEVVVVRIGSASRSLTGGAFP